MGICLENKILYNKNIFEIKMAKKKKKEKIDWRILCTALVCLTILELYAISQGIDGVIFGIVLMIIAGIVGIIIPNPLKHN
jgi:hypothetical protein